MGALNAGIKKELNKNRGTLQLSVSDLLRTIRINTYYGTLTEEAFLFQEIWWQWREECRQSAQWGFG